MSVILGIDPGVARLGYGVINNDGGAAVCVTYGCLETPKEMPQPERLLTLSRALREIIAQYKPNAVAIEVLRFGKNRKTAMVVSEARGVALTAAAEAQVLIYEIAPTQVKQALTSSGAADKKQVQFMVQQILKLKEIPEPDDAADALAIALTAEPLLKMPRQ